VYNDIAETKQIGHVDVDFQMRSILQVFSLKWLVPHDFVKVGNLLLL